MGFDSAGEEGNYPLGDLRCLLIRIVRCGPTMVSYATSDCQDALLENKNLKACASPRVLTVETTSDERNAWP